MSHRDHAAFVPLRFTDALHAGEIDGVQYLLGSFLADACYRGRNTSDGIAAIRLATLVELNVAELLNLSLETVAGRSTT